MITTRAHGIDISKYDLRFDPSLAVEQLDFVIQRASYGALDGRVYKDEAFDALYPGVSRMAVRGAYHYLNSHMGWQAQMDFFLSVTNGKGFQFYVVDFESDYNVMSQAFAKMAWDSIQYLKVQTGKPVFLYTNWNLYVSYITPSEATYHIDWDTVPLWQAQYFYTVNPNGQPSNPTGRTAGWKMWQYTPNGNGVKFGCGRSTACDLNVWNGTLADMKTFLGITEVPPAANPTAHVKFTDKDGRVFSGDVELKPE